MVYVGAIGILLAVHHPEWVKSLFLFEPGLATFVTDPADAQLVGEDRTDMRALAAMAIEAGDTRVAVRLLVDGVTEQPGTFERLAPAIRSWLLDNARTVPLSLGPSPPPPNTCAQLSQIAVPVAIARVELARPFYRIVADTVHRCIPGSRADTEIEGRAVPPSGGEAIE
jgi:pimeloyl-ACP methyl ester carboxylesterase